MHFPIQSTKVLGVNKQFDLTDPADRHRYFYAKAGKEIEDLKNYLSEKSFVGFLLAKKGAGKGTYAKMVAEVLGEARIAHISVGDVIRSAHLVLENEEDNHVLCSYLEKNYRGYIPLDEAISALTHRTVFNLIPTELILTLIKYEVEKIGERGLFIDGFPRSLDQVSYSLFFREIMNLSDNPDFLVFIEISDSVLTARFKNRLVCPHCQTSRNLTLNPTKFVSFDKSEDKVILKCDNKNCSGYGSAVLVSKENDDLGIEAIRDRIEADEALMKKADDLRGVEKIYLRNLIPVNEALENVDDYEITPQFKYRLKDDGSLAVEKLSWVIKDDTGVESYSLLPAAVVLSFIREMHRLLI